MKWLFAAACVAASAPGTSSAQTVRGTVLAADGSAPVTGAVVILRDSAGSVVGRMLSGRAGEFALTAPAAGTYDLRILRIGYRPSSVPRFALSVGEIRTVPARLNGGAVQLAAIQVTGGSECELRPDSGQAAFAVWEEAKKALTLMVLTRRVPPSVRLRRYTRLVDPRDKTVVRENAREERRVSDRAFVSLPAETLLVRGFVQQDSGGSVYNAPDADVLLAERFADTHCMRLASTSDAQSIGLQFAPVRSREDVSDITGVLWLDRTTGQLDSLDYRYTNLPRAIEEAGAGGRVSFLRLDTGGWVVRGWEIRIPQVRVRERSTLQSAGSMSMGGSRIERQRVTEVTGIQLEGGEVLEVTQAGATVWAHRALSITLRLVDAATRAPVRARGVVSGTNARFDTDNTGSTTLAGMYPGDYTLELQTALRDSLRLDSFRARLTVVGDASSVVELALPSRGATLRGLCGADLEQRKEAVIFGTVLDSTGAPVPNAVVVALWQAKAVTSGSTLSVRTEQRSTHADASGRFRICGVPQERPARFFAGEDTRSARAIPVTVPSGRTITEVRLRSAQ